MFIQQKRGLRVAREGGGSESKITFISTIIIILKRRNERKVNDGKLYRERVREREIEKDKVREKERERARAGNSLWKSG